MLSHVNESGQTRRIGMRHESLAACRQVDVALNGYIRLSYGWDRLSAATLARSIKE